MNHDYDPTACKTMGSPPPSEAQKFFDAVSGVPTQPSKHSTGLTNSQKLDLIFTYQRINPDELAKTKQVQAAAKQLAAVIMDCCPACADRSAAIRLVREASMTANAAIALNGVSL